MACSRTADQVRTLLLEREQKWAADAEAVALQVRETRAWPNERLRRPYRLLASLW